MLLLLATFVFSAFPVRGSLVRSLDSAFVIDKDTVRVVAVECCVCTNRQYTVSTGTAETSRFKKFPGSQTIRFANVYKKDLGMDASGMIRLCGETKLTIWPEEERRFILHGQTNDWAVWADSLTLGAGDKISALWRWSRIDSTRPWVRWIDTVKLANPSPAKPNSLRTIPVLTTLRTIRLDSIVPKLVSCAHGLVLRARPDTTTNIDWGYRGDSCVEMSTYTATFPYAILPGDSIRLGTTFRILDAYNSWEYPSTWRFLSGRKVEDSLVLTGYATTTGLPKRTAAPAQPLGSEAFDLATGRRVEIKKSLPTGRRLLDGPAGTRMIVVK